MAGRNVGGPQFVRFFGPVIAALRDLGGSGQPSEVRANIATLLSIPEEERSTTLKSGQSRFENQVHWARFYLAKAGYLSASERGVWTLTDKGRSIPPLNPAQAMMIFKEVQANFKTISSRDGEPAPTKDSELAGETHYRSELLEVLQALPPAGFERLCQRLLREAGFEQVVVTGRPGDKGIDGHGVLQVNPLVSFKVLFQCKRFSSSVTAPDVRDFRGAMMGRADKGIIITTGSFTADAQQEATRDGTHSIQLVSSEKLIDMFERLEFGLIPRRTFEIDRAFFDQFK